MSSLVKTEAVVLRSVKYRETSRIVTFYTLEFGKLKGIAKGVRRGGKVLAAVLEPMSYVSLVVYKKEKRDIQFISQCDLLDYFRGIRESLDKIMTGLSVVELTDMLTKEGDKNPQFFRMTAAVLSSLDRAKRNYRNYLYAFEIYLAATMGFRPDFNSCVSCGAKLVIPGVRSTQIDFRLDRGGALCKSCITGAGQGLKISVSAFQVMKTLAAMKNFTGIQNIGIGEKPEKEIERFLWDYLNYHFGGIRKLRSQAVLSRLQHRVKNY